MGYVTINCFSSFRTINTILKWIPPAVSRTPPKAMIGYLALITAPPTEMSVIYAFIDRAFKIKTEHELEKMFIEVDQAIYSKLLDAMFKISENKHVVFSKLIPRMEGFHIIMCMLKTVFSRFKDSGTIKLFVYSGMSGEKTIKHALKGGDLKFSIYSPKLMLEAIIKTKIIYLENSALFPIDENAFQNIIHLQKDISVENFQNVCESLQTLQKLTSGLSCLLELYLDMVTVLLNTVYA